MKKTPRKRRKQVASKATSIHDRHAKAKPSDKEIWLSVDGDMIITLYKLIKVNSEPGVTRLSESSVSNIRKLKVGEVWWEFPMPIKRVSKPRQTPSKKRKATPKPKKSK